MEEKRIDLEENLEAFKKKFLLFFIGLVGFAIGMVIVAFGTDEPILIMLVWLCPFATWGVPVGFKFWNSGLAGVFDFHLVTYEVDKYGNKRDVSDFMTYEMGTILKIFCAVLACWVGIAIAPIEMIVRLINHFRIEKQLGEKGTIKDSPRREAVLCAIVLVAMFVLAIVGNIVATVNENTSDIANEEIIELLETLETKKMSYTIVSDFDYVSEHTTTYAEVTEQDGKISFVAYRELTYYEYVDLGEHNTKTYYYKIPQGTYTYENGAWTDADEQCAYALKNLTIGLAFDFDKITENPNEIIVNKKSGLSGRIDKNEHDYYEFTPKNGSELKFNNFSIEEDFAFVYICDLVYLFN